MHDLFSQPTAQQLAKEGLDRAVKSADKKIISWSSQCWLVFLQFLEEHGTGSQFQVNDFVWYCRSRNRLQMPPSLRAFGFLPARGIKLYLIEWIGTKKTDNKKAHAARAGYYKIK